MSIADYTKSSAVSFMTKDILGSSSGVFSDDLIKNAHIILGDGASGDFTKYTGFIRQAATIWEKDPTHKIIDKFANQLQSDPALKARFDRVMAKDLADNGQLDEASRQMTAYASGRPLAELVGQSEIRLGLRQAPKAAPVAAAPPAPAKVEPTHHHAEEKKSAPVHHKAVVHTAPADSEGPKTPDATPPSPIAAVAGAGIPVAPAAASGDVFTSERAFGLASGFGATINGIFGNEFDGDVNSMLKKMQMDPTIGQKIADAMNADPALKAKLTGPDGGNMLDTYSKQDAKTQKAIQDAMRPFVKDFLADPTKMVDTKFQSDMESASTQGGFASKINGFMQGIFGKDFDFSKIMSGAGSGIMSFIQPLLDMVGNLFNGFSAGGGMGNFMSMGNGSGGMLENFMSGISKSAALGQSISENERFINEEGHVVEHSKIKDGKFSDGMVLNADGTPKMVQDKDKDGKPKVDQDGKPVMVQEYNPNLDDRVEVPGSNGTRRFEIAGVTDGSVKNSDGTRNTLRAYAAKVDPQTGAIYHSEVINIGPSPDYSISKTDPETNKPIQPSAPGAPAFAAQPGMPTGPSQPSPASGPPINAALFS